MGTAQNAQCRQGALRRSETPSLWPVAPCVCPVLAHLGLPVLFKPVQDVLYCQRNLDSGAGLKLCMHHLFTEHAEQAEHGETLVLYAESGTEHGPAVAMQSSIRERALLSDVGWGEIIRNDTVARMPHCAKPS